jgi:hypothetical protein
MLVCQLPAAFRRLPRPSSPVIAKASTTCTLLLDPITPNALAHIQDHRIDSQRLPSFTSPTLHFLPGTRLLRSTQSLTQIDYPSSPRSQPRPHRVSPMRAAPLALTERSSPSSTLLKNTTASAQRTEDSPPKTPRFGPRALAVLGSLALVEPTGIEPVTSCLQSRRSPS